MATEAGLPSSQVSVKTALTVTMTVLGVAIAVVGAIEARLAILMAATAALFATALHHGVDVLTRRRVRRPAAIALVITAGLALLAGLFLLLIPAAVQQGTALVDDAPRILKRAQQTDAYRFVDQRWGLLGNSTSSPTDALREAALPTLHAVTGVVGGIATIVTTFFLTIFMLIFGSSMVQVLLGEAIDERRALYERVVRKIYVSVGGYLAGLSFICSVNATMATTFLAIARVPFFLPVGILAGFSSLIPYGGPVIAGVVVTLLALVTKGVWVALATLIYWVVYGQIEGQILSPIVFKRTINVNPLVTLLSILFFAEIGGVIGAVLAVPMAAAGQIVLGELLAIRRERLQISR